MVKLAGLGQKSLDGGLSTVTWLGFLRAFVSFQLSK